MSRYKGNKERCPTCDITYKNLKTGFSYQEVHDLMLDEREDPATWKYKRRNTVLGLWFQIKQEMWKRHKTECAQAIEYAERCAIECECPDDAVSFDFDVEAIFKNPRIFATHATEGAYAP